MENVKKNVFGNIFPCLDRRNDIFKAIPNFVKIDVNGFKIVDSIHTPEEDDVYKGLRSSDDENYLNDDVFSDGYEDDSQDKSDLCIDNMCYQYGKVNLDPMMYNMMSKRKESRYRVMMSLRGDEVLQPPVNINEVVSFVPNFILNNLMDDYNSKEGDLDECAVSLKTLEYEAIVVFCDASGFTSLADSLCRSKYGAVRLGNCLNKFLDPLIDTIYSWGGEIISFSGDAVTACWLIPTNDESAEIEKKSTNYGLCALSCCSELHLGLNEFPTPLADKVLSLHIGVGYGQLKFTPIKVDQDSAISFIITGSSIVEATTGGVKALGGETVIGPNVYEILNNVIRTTPVESGYHKIKHITCVLPSCPENNDSKKFDKDVFPLLEELIQPNIFNRVCSGIGSFFSEMRRITSVFVGLRSISLMDSKIEDYAAKLHIECKRVSSVYGGVLNKINVDDKGVSALLLFGLPPDYRFDYATRAVNAARNIVARCKASAGVVTGYAWCGLVGNSKRKEYTALGDLINLSARLMGMADDGQILVDKVTFKRVKKIPLVLSTHKRVKGKTGDLDIYRVCNRNEDDYKMLLKNQTLSNNIPHFIGKLINWSDWPFRKNISKILDPLILKGGVKNISVTKGDGLTEAILLSINYFGTKNWITLRVKNNWKELIDKILYPDKISVAKQLLPPRFHSRLGALFDSSLFGEDINMLKKFSLGLDLEGARKVWGSPYEVLVEIFRGYAKSFGSAGVAIIVETNEEDLILKEMIDVVLSDNNKAKKVAILTISTEHIKNVSTSFIESLTQEESKQLIAHILRQPINSQIDLITEYAYNVTGGASKHLYQTIKLLISKGIIRWEKINYHKGENGEGELYDNDESSESDSDSDFSVSVASGSECSDDDLESINGECKGSVEEYGGIILKESLDSAPIIESMWTEAIEIVDNIPENLLKEAISIALFTGKISTESFDSETLEILERQGVLRIDRGNGECDKGIIYYMVTNGAIKRILNEKHISQIYNQAL